MFRLSNNLVWPIQVPDIHLLHRHPCKKTLFILLYIIINNIYGKEYLRKNLKSVSTPPHLWLTQQRYKDPTLSTETLKELKIEAGVMEATICFPALESWEKDQVKVSLSLSIKFKANQTNPKCILKRSRNNNTVIHRPNYNCQTFIFSSKHWNFEFTFIHCLVFVESCGTEEDGLCRLMKAEDISLLQHPSLHTEK